MSAEILWGIVGFVIGALSGSFLGAAGKDLYDFVKRQFKQSYEVDPGYVSTLYPPQNCAWIPEENLKNKEKNKWGYHPHPARGGKCFRTTSNSKFPKKEYLMVTPNAKKL